jgi:CheY-like chemotaxis protein
MTEKSSTVLLAGIGRGPFEAIAPVLERRNVSISHAFEPEEAVVLAATRQFDLVIFDGEPEQLGLAELVERLRARGSASRGSSLLVVAEPESAEEGRKLVGHGVNRLVTLDMPEEIIAQHVADLLDVAPRAAVRIRAQLTTVCEDGKVEIVGRTSNISVTGLLLETPSTLEVGQRVRFELLTAGGDDMVSGEAEVVQQATSAREGINSVGVRFVELHGRSRELIEAFLAEVCAGS